MNGFFLGSAPSWTDSMGPTALRLALELAVAVLGAWLAAHLGRTGCERRSVWRVAIALLVVVTAAEITGATRMALALTSRATESATPPLANAEFAVPKREVAPGIRPPRSVAES